MLYALHKFIIYLNKCTRVKLKLMMDNQTKHINKIDPNTRRHVVFGLPNINTCCYANAIIQVLCSCAPIWNLCTARRNQYVNLKREDGDFNTYPFTYIFDTLITTVNTGERHVAQSSVYTRILRYMIRLHQYQSPNSMSRYRVMSALAQQDDDEFLRTIFTLSEQEPVCALLPQSSSIRPEQREGNNDTNAGLPLPGFDFADRLLKIVEGDQKRRLTLSTLLSASTARNMINYIKAKGIPLSSFGALFFCFYFTQGYDTRKATTQFIKPVHNYGLDAFALNANEKMSVQGLIDRTYGNQQQNGEVISDTLTLFRYMSILPLVLYIPLHRGMHSRGVNVKINTELYMPVFRDAADWIHIKYTLVGFTVYSGNGQSGHYYSVAMVNNQWYVFNDMSVSMIDGDKLSMYEHGVKSLFYVKHA